MTYYLLENLGLSMVLIVILYGLSWILLQMKRFRAHIDGYRVFACPTQRRKE